MPPTRQTQNEPPRSPLSDGKRQSCASYLTTHPDDAAAHLKLGHLYIDHGKYGLAENEAQAAQHIGGQYTDDADALFAWTLFLEGDENRLLAKVHPANREAHDESGYV